MTGKELYQKLSQRDYSGSDADEYAQFLQTIFLQLSLQGKENEFYSLLEKSQESGKMLSVENSELDEYTLESISLV
ncbi:hypothetical protein [Chryseobacterium sp.]|uniref:hypothetical protein n=1 Tax=Chryseobacterium sp. TaxID=1871047 RepID=UPI0028995387|nr:hypothetical protein [Chryseobacterium sp.]